MREICLFHVMAPIMGCGYVRAATKNRHAANRVPKYFMTSWVCQSERRKTTTLLAYLAAAAATLVSPRAPAQITAVPSMPPPVEVVFVCPLDRSIRSQAPGECERRGRRAELIAEVPEPLEFPLELTSAPSRLSPGVPARLRFQVRDPWMGRVVEDFTVVHEALFHVFLVSADLEFFSHEHPQWTGDSFELDVTLRKSGLYRVLVDFLPAAATPQLLTRTLFVSGNPSEPALLVRDYSRKQAQNLSIEMSTTPEDPVAGSATVLRFALNPHEGIEPYLGVLGHMLVASDDLIDLIHAHPVTAQIGPIADFAVVFPRASVYRVWVQFQREGIVNTVNFDVHVRPVR
jgi:hypothetical protein